ncbi:MAG: hypothetical protein VX438_17860 [Planctomycetota bacterium]|nr:hypothetical protein [Planctomycetota bacterium]
MKTVLWVFANKKHDAILIAVGIVLAITCVNCCFGQVQFQNPTWRDLDPKPSGIKDEQEFPGKQVFDLASSGKSKIPKTIVTRQTVFGVPFTINPEFGPVREVQLHISLDKGKTWSLYSRQLPGAREFPFRATTDGLYWFAVKTVGSQLPKRELTPELVIAIDSSKPSFEIELKTDNEGRMVVGWQAADQNLDPDSVRVTYRPASQWGKKTTRWQDVRLPKSTSSLQRFFQEEVAFYPSVTGETVIDFQISIADQAGNITIVNRRYHLPKTVLGPQRPNRETNIAQRMAVKQDAPLSGPPSLRPPSTDPYAKVTQAEKDAAAGSVGLNSRFDPESGPVLNAGSKLASSQFRKDGWNIVGNNGFSQDFYNNSPDESDYKTRSNEIVPGSINDPGFQNPNQLASSTRSIDAETSPNQGGHQINRIPDGHYAKLSSSRKFELDYQVEHIQATDISKLEIWVTRDLGQTWKLNSVDPDRQSPVGIEVDDDGVFGYRIRIQTVDGLESIQPTRGDSADVWVEVDTTKPSVELLSAPYGRKSDAGKLIINWRATDRRLSSKPVTLYYSVKLDGPWQIIVEKLENTGQFKWPVTTRVPKSVYVRIAAVDAAGNQNFHQTQQPIDLSGLNPRGMIKGVRPLQ